MQINNLHSLHNKKYNSADKEKWIELIKEWEKSNETQTAFCRRYHLDIKLFSYVKNKLLLKKTQSQFIPVSIKKEIPITSTVENIILESPKGIKLYLPMSIASDQLVNILRIIGWPC